MFSLTKRRCRSSVHRIEIAAAQIDGHAEGLGHCAQFFHHQRRGEAAGYVGKEQHQGPPVVETLL